MSDRDFGEVIGKRAPDDPPPPFDWSELGFSEDEVRALERRHPLTAEERARNERMRCEAVDWHLPENLDE